MPLAANLARRDGRGFLRGFFSRFRVLSASPPSGGFVVLILRTDGATLMRRHLANHHRHRLLLSLAVVDVRIRIVLRVVARVVRLRLFQPGHQRRLQT